MPQLLPLKHYHNYNKISNVFLNRDKKENEAPFNIFFPSKTYINRLNILI